MRTDAEAVAATAVLSKLHDLKDDEAVRLQWVLRRAPGVRPAQRPPQTKPSQPSMLEQVLTDASMPIEVRRLGRPVRRWRDQILAWHRCRHTNGPTESTHNLSKRVKRVAFGFRSFANFRIRVLIYAGQPNWASSTASPHDPRLNAKSPKSLPAGEQTLKTN